MLKISFLSLVGFMVFAVSQASAATLVVSPSVADIIVGGTFSVNILLDTEGAEIHGVDVNALNYDPAILEVQDANGIISGVQISPGTLMPVVTYNDVSGGRIVFSQVTNDGLTFNGQGVLVSINFTALKTGTANVTFDFTPGSTIDSNVAEDGIDALDGVTNGTYNITVTTPTPTPTPDSSGDGGGDFTQSMPTPTPVPSIGPGQSANPSDYGLREGDMVSATGSFDPDIYIINENGFKRLFLNPVIFGFYGHLGGFQNVKTVSSQVRDVFSTTQFFRNCETGDSKIYALNVTGEDTGKLHHINISGTQAVAEDPAFFKKVFCINSNEFNWYTGNGQIFGEPYTTLANVPRYVRGQLSMSPSPAPPVSSLLSSLVKTSDSPTIYYINSSGVKKSIPSLEIFYSYNNKFENVKTVTQSQLDSFPSFQAIKLAGGDSKIYTINSTAKTKHWVKDAATLSQLNLDLGRVVDVNQTEFDYYTTGIDAGLN
ncbi:MAG: hypothetical protein HYT65_00895 [Candidatus Yanofskybacteria bacterium]|nr:hypothetical protein [Candidatus Yanofskybacteria bacterium]